MSIELHSRMGTLYPEMSVHEKAGLDFYIDLLRKSQLDENVPIDNAEKCLQASSGSGCHHQKNHHLDLKMVCSTFNTSTRCISARSGWTTQPSSLPI